VAVEESRLLHLDLNPETSFCMPQSMMSWPWLRAISLNFNEPLPPLGAAAWFLRMTCSREAHWLLLAFHMRFPGSLLGCMLKPRETTTRNDDLRHNRTRQTAPFLLHVLPPFHVIPPFFLFILFRHGRTAFFPV
jgi:hypothetical protein